MTTPRHFERLPNGKLACQVFADDRRYDYCLSCNAPIIWVHTTAKGKAAPVKDTPLDAERIITTTDYDSGEERMFMESHFAHCPQAKKWRKNK